MRNPLLQLFELEERNRLKYGLIVIPEGYIEKAFNELNSINQLTYSYLDIINLIYSNEINYKEKVYQNVFLTSENNYTVQNTTHNPRLLLAFKFIVYQMSYEFVTYKNHTYIPCRTLRPEFTLKTEVESKYSLFKDKILKEQKEKGYYTPHFEFEFYLKLNFSNPINPEEEINYLKEKAQNAELYLVAGDVSLFKDFNNQRLTRFQKDVFIAIHPFVIREVYPISFSEYHLHIRTKGDIFLPKITFDQLNNITEEFKDFLKGVEVRTSKPSPSNEYRLPPGVILKVVDNTYDARGYSETLDRTSLEYDIPSKFYDIVLCEEPFAVESFIKLDYWKQNKKYINIFFNKIQFNNKQSVFKKHILIRIQRRFSIQKHLSVKVNQYHYSKIKQKFLRIINYHKPFFFKSPRLNYNKYLLKFRNFSFRLKTYQKSLYYEIFIIRHKYNKRYYKLFYFSIKEKYTNRYKIFKFSLLNRINSLFFVKNIYLKSLKFLYKVLNPKIHSSLTIYKKFFLFVKQGSVKHRKILNIKLGRQHLLNFKILNLVNKKASVYFRNIELKKLKHKYSFIILDFINNIHPIIFVLGSLTVNKSLNFKIISIEHYLNKLKYSLHFFHIDNKRNFSYITSNLYYKKYRIKYLTKVINLKVGFIYKQFQLKVNFYQKYKVFAFNLKSKLKFYYFNSILYLKNKHSSKYFVSSFYLKQNKGHYRIFFLKRKDKLSINQKFFDIILLKKLKHNLLKNSIVFNIKKLKYKPIYYQIFTSRLNVKYIQQKNISVKKHLLKYSNRNLISGVRKSFSFSKTLPSFSKRKQIFIIRTINFWKPAKVKYNISHFILKSKNYKFVVLNFVDFRYKNLEYIRINVVSKSTLVKFSFYSLNVRFLHKQFSFTLSVLKLFKNSNKFFLLHFKSYNKRQSYILANLKNYFAVNNKYIKLNFNVLYSNKFRYIPGKIFFVESSSRFFIKRIVSLLRKNIFYKFVRYSIKVKHLSLIAAKFYLLNVKYRYLERNSPKLIKTKRNFKYLVSYFRHQDRRLKQKLYTNVVFRHFEKAKQYIFNITIGSIKINKFLIKLSLGKNFVYYRFNFNIFFNKSKLSYIRILAFSRIKLYYKVNKVIKFAVKRTDFKTYIKKFILNKRKLSFVKNKIYTYKENLLKYFKHNVYYEDKVKLSLIESKIYVSRSSVSKIKKRIYVSFSKIYKKKVKIKGIHYSIFKIFSSIIIDGKGKFYLKIINISGIYENVGGKIYAFINLPIDFILQEQKRQHLNKLKIYSSKAIPAITQIQTVIENENNITYDKNKIQIDLYTKYVEQFNVEINNPIERKNFYKNKFSILLDQEYKSPRYNKIHGISSIKVPLNTFKKARISSSKILKKVTFKKIYQDFNLKVHFIYTVRYNLKVLLSFFHYKSINKKYIPYKYPIKRVNLNLTKKNILVKKNKSEFKVNKKIKPCTYFKVQIDGIPESTCDYIDFSLELNNSYKNLFVTVNIFNIKNPIEHSIFNGIFSTKGQLQFYTDYKTFTLDRCDAILDCENKIINYSSIDDIIKKDLVYNIDKYSKSSLVYYKYVQNINEKEKYLEYISNLEIVNNTKNKVKVNQKTGEDITIDLKYDTDNPYIIKTITNNKDFIVDFVFLNTKYYDFKIVSFQKDNPDYNNLDYKKVVDFIKSKYNFYVLGLNILDSVFDGILYERLFFKNDERIYDNTDLVVIRNLKSKIFVVDEVQTDNNIDESFKLNSNEGFIPSYDCKCKQNKVFNLNFNPITDINQVNNFAYVKNIQEIFSSKEEMISYFNEVPFDLIILPLLDITISDVENLRYKKYGRRRMIFGLLDIDNRKSLEEIEYEYISKVVDLNLDGVMIG